VQRGRTNKKCKNGVLVIVLACPPTPARATPLAHNGGQGQHLAGTPCACHMSLHLITTAYTHALCISSTLYTTWCMQGEKEGVRVHTHLTHT